MNFFYIFLYPIVLGDMPFSAERLSSDVNTLSMTMNKMLIKLDNAHADIRRHEDELRRLGRECAPMVHGHPSIRRRIKNDLQPQINKLNQEIRSLKEANGATSSSGLERHALHEMQKQIAHFQRQINTVERNQQLVSKNEINQDFLAHKLITEQKMSNIVRDISGINAKLEVTERKIDRQGNSDQKLISDFEGVIDNVMRSFDQKLSLVRGELKEDITRAKNPMQILNPQQQSPLVDLESNHKMDQFESRLDELEIEVTAVQEAQSESSKIRETDDMMMEIDEHINNVEEQVQTLSQKLDAQELKMMAYSDIDGNREDIIALINDDLSKMETKIKSNIAMEFKFLADEWRNFAGSYETMQADIEQLKIEIETKESDPAKTIDLATQIIAQEQMNLKRFDEIKRRLSSLEVGLPDDVEGDFEVLKAKIEQLEIDSSELDLKTIDRINELGSRIGTQLNAHSVAIEQVRKVANGAQAHNNGFVLSGEFDNVLQTMEKMINRNITNMALKVRDSNLKVNEVESKINQIEDIAMGADRAAKQSSRIAETLMDSIQESFTQMESKEEENSRRVHRKLNDFAHQLEVLDRMAQTNMTNLNRRQKEFERNQHNDERLLQTLNLGMSQLDHKASTNSAILGQIDNHILQSQKAEKERDGIKNQIQSMESNLQNLQSVLAKLMEETDFFGKTQTLLPQHQTQMDGTLFSQVQTLALEIKRLEAAHDQSEARVVRLSQNSDDYKRQVRQLYANIQSLVKNLELIETELDANVDLSGRNYDRIELIEKNFKSFEENRNQSRLSTSSMVEPAHIEQINEKIKALSDKKHQNVGKEDFYVFKNMIEDELESIEEKLSKEGIKLSNIIKRISNDYSSLEHRDQTLNSSLLELQTVVAMLGDSPLLIEQPEFVDLQLNLKSVQSDIGQLQSGLQIGNEKTEALKKEITLIEGELEENRDMSRSHQEQLLIASKLKEAIQAQADQNERFSNDFQTVKKRLLSHENSINEVSYLPEEVKIIKNQTEETQFLLNNVVAEFERQDSEVRESLSRLESDFVNFEFVIDDELIPQLMMLNETMQDIEDEIQSTVPDSVQRIEHLLMDEIENKFKKINDNMQKFSDVSSLSANELRGLFESELLQLHSKLSNQEKKYEAAQTDQIGFNIKTSNGLVALEDKTKYFETTLNDMSGIVSSQAMNFESKNLEIVKQIENLKIQEDQSQRDLESLKNHIENELESEIISEFIEKQTEFSRKFNKTIGQNEKAIKDVLSVQKQFISASKSEFDKVEKKLEHDSTSVNRKMVQMNEKINELRKMGEDHYGEHSQGQRRMKAEFHEAWSNTTQLQSKFNQLKKHVANMIKNSDRRLDMNAENDEVLNSKIKTMAENIRSTHSEISDLENKVTTKEKLTAVVRIIETRLESNEKETRDLENQMIEEIEKIDEKIDQINRSYDDIENKNTKMDQRFSKALAYEKQNTIRAISAIESKISNPIQTVQNKLDSFEQMVMDELNKNDENDKLCVENILSLNRTLVEQSTAVFGSQNELSSMKKLVSSNKKAADQSATLLRDQMILHNDMLRGLSGINRTEMERSIEDQTKIIDQIGEIMSDVEASKMELNSFKFHSKANYNSLSADFEKLKSSDVFDDVATLVLKVGSLNKVVNGNQQDIEQIESDIKQLEISNKRETRYISRLESKMTTRNEDFEEFKTKLNSTMFNLQSSVSELESQLGNIKDETTTDVEEIVDGFDILIDSLNTVSFDLDEMKRRRRRRSSGQSKLISKIHQLAETFKKMRMSVRDTEERLEEVDEHFIGINDKFIESNEAVTRLQTGLNNSYKQISEVFDMINKLTNQQLTQEQSMAELALVDDRNLVHFDLMRNNSLELTDLASKMSKLETKFGIETGRIDGKADERHSVLTQGQENTEIELLLLSKSIRYLNDTVVRKLDSSDSKISQFERKLDRATVLAAENIVNVNEKIEEVKTDLSDDQESFENRSKQKISHLEKSLESLIEANGEQQVLITTLDGKQNVVDGTIAIINNTLDEISEKLNVITVESQEKERSLFSQNDAVKTLEVKFTALETDIIRQTTQIKGVNKHIEDLQAATETMTDNEDFLEHMTKLSNLLKLSNNTVESTIATVQSDINDLKTNNDALLKKWNSDFESFETEARKRMEKDSRELELEFNIFNKDMTAKFKAYENNLRRNIDQTRDAFTALEKLEQDNVNQKSSMLQQNEKNRQFSSKSISLEEKLEEQRTQLISFKQKLKANKDYSDTISTTFKSDILKNTELLEDLKLQANQNSMKLNDHDQNFGNFDQKIENFTDGQKKHLHNNVNRRLEAVELAEKQTFDLIQSLNSQIEVDRQEFERMVALEKVFKDNVAADVKRMNQTLLKNDVKSDLKHVRSLINTRLDALESGLGEIKSTRATKSVTNRLTEQTGLLRTRIDDLKNKLDRELNEASDDLKDEINEIEETMKTDLSMVKNLLSNVQNSQDRVSSNQGELQQTLRVLQIEDSGIRNELGQLSADVNRRLNYKEDKISAHSKELKQQKTQLNLVSSNLDYIRTLVPADLDEKLLQLEQADARTMEQVRSNNGSISAWFAASQNFATADEMSHIQKQITRHESSLDLVNVNFDSLKSRFENQALEVESLSSLFDEKQVEIMNSIENRHSDIQSKIKSSEDEVFSTKTRLQDGHSKIEKLLSEMTSLKEFINSELATQRTNVRSNIDELEDKLRQYQSTFESFKKSLKNDLTSHLEGRLATKDESVSNLETDLKKMDRSYQNIQNELLNLEQIQTKIRHNKEIADQQFQLLNQEIVKTNQDFESLLDQNKKSTDETVGKFLTELTDMNSNVEIIVEKTKQVDLLTQEVNRLEVNNERMSDKFEHFARKEETKVLSDTISETSQYIDSRMKKVEDKIDQSNELKDELFEDLSSVSEQNQKTTEEMAQVKETLAAKDEIIRHLTSQQSSLRNKIQRNSGSINKLEQTINATLSDFQKSLDEEDGVSTDSLMPKLGKIFASKVELNREIDSVRNSYEKQGAGLHQSIQKSFDLLNNRQTDSLKLIGEYGDKSEKEIKLVRAKMGDFDSRIEMNKMELENFLVDKEKLQGSVVKINLKAEANHDQILNLDKAIKKTDSNVQDTKAIILAKDDATTKTIATIESGIRSLKSDLATFKGQVPSGLVQSVQRPSSRSNEISNSEVETFLAAITSENKNIEDKIAKISRSNSTIFERISKIEDGINYQNQQIAKLQSSPVPVNDYDIYDGSEETDGLLPSGGLTERMKVLENRFKEIQWDLDTVIQQEDDKDLNGTREELEQLNYKVDIIETQLEKHGYSHIQTTLEVNKQIDGIIQNMIEVTNDITEKTNNVTNAFMFFNLTTGFQFSELGNRLSELETQISDQRSQSSDRGQGIDHNAMVNLNRTVFTIEKQQNLIKSNLDLITRKMDRSDDEINFLLKYVNNQGATSSNSGGSKSDSNDWLEWSLWSTCSVTCGTGKEMRTRICKDNGSCVGNSIEERPCEEGSCIVPCWTEWNEWNNCSKSCGGGMKRRNRGKNPNATSQSRCIGSDHEVVQCNTHPCSERKPLILMTGGRGQYMQESSVINVNLGTEKRKIAKRSTKLAMHCSETLNQKVYLIGGYYTRKYIHTIDDEQCNIRRMSVLLPVDYMRHSCAVHDGRIFMCGSYRDNVRCDSFDGYRVKREPNMNDRHNQASLVSVPSRGLMIIGGTGSPSQKSQTEILSGNRWTQGPSLPTKITSSTANAIGSDVYIFGGHNEVSTKSVYVLKEGATSWKLLSNQLHQKRASHVSVTMLNKVYLIGGEGDTVVEEWDPELPKTRVLSGIKHSNRLYSAALILPSNVCTRV